MNGEVSQFSVESLMRELYNGLGRSGETTNDGSSLIHVVINRMGSLPAVMAVVEEGTRLDSEWVSWLPAGCIR